MNRRGFLGSLLALLGVGAVVPKAFAADPYDCTCGCGLPRGVHDGRIVPEDAPRLPGGGPSERIVTRHDFDVIETDIHTLELIVRGGNTTFRTTDRGATWTRDKP